MVCYTPHTYMSLLRTVADLCDVTRLDDNEHKCFGDIIIMYSLVYTQYIHSSR